MKLEAIQTLPKKRNNPRKISKLESFKKQASILELSQNFLNFNFGYFIDNDTGQSFLHWQQNETLAPFMEKLKNFSQKTKKELKQDKTLEIYHNFPPHNKTDFNLPKSLPENGIDWARLRITGKSRIIGFFITEGTTEQKNIFYLVYLDENHLFWKSKLKHT